MKIKAKYFLILLLVIFVVKLFNGCSEKNSPNQPILSDEEKIQSLYNEFASYYNDENVSGIIGLYSDSYLHDGIIKSDLNDIWDGRIGWNITRIVIQTTINGNIAECVADMYYTDNGIPDSMHAEPGGEDDDVCYLRKEESDWKIYGNQILSFMKFQKNSTAINWSVCKFWKSSNEIEVYSGPSQQDDEDFEFRLTLTEGNLPSGTYSNHDRVSSIHYYEYSTIENVSISITKFDMNNRIVEGTFSATLKNLGNQTIHISEGFFRAID